MNGVSLHWFGNLFEKQAVGDFGGSLPALADARADGHGGDGGRLAARPASPSAAASAARRRCSTSPIASLIVPSILSQPRHRPAVPACSACEPAWYSSAFGAHLTWTLPFGAADHVRRLQPLRPALRGGGARPRRHARGRPSATSCCRSSLPSLIGVGLFGFTLSYDEFARTLLTSGTFNTLPLEIYGMTTNVTTPVLYALGTRDHRRVVPGDRAGAGLLHLGAPPPPAARQRRRQGGMSISAAPVSCGSPTAGPQDTAPLAAAIDRGRDRSRDHRRHRRQDRGQRLRQRFHPRLRHARLEAPAGRAPEVPDGRGRGARRHRHVGRHRRRAVAASAGVLPRDGGSRGAAAPRLAIGVGLTRAFKPEEIGRAAQIAATAEAVAAAMKDAGIASAADVHFVQIKCPLLTKERIEEAERRGADRGDRRHLPFDGPVARRLGAGRRPGAGRDRRRSRSGRLPATGRSIPKSPARRPASSSCAMRSSCWATRRNGRATW